MSSEKTITEKPAPEQDIRVVLADDHEIFRDGFKLTIGKLKNIKLVGAASNGAELVQMVRELKPHVVITDIKMPMMDGIQATKRILQVMPHMPVIGLSMFDEEDLILEMIEAGAKGYLVKNADKKEVTEAIRSVYAGEEYFCKHTSARLAHAIGKRNVDYNKKLNAVHFTEKEIEIIELICQQYNTSEISEKLFMAVRTVEGYRVRLLDKMGVKNTVGIVIYAIQNGLYQP